MTLFKHIETWWGQLQKNGASRWMDFFKELRNNGEVDDSNEVHMYVILLTAHACMHVVVA